MGKLEFSNEFQWKYNQDMKIYIQDDNYANAILFRPQCKTIPHVMFM